MSTLDPSTHAYSFWEGVPESSRRSFGRLFRASKTLQVAALYSCKLPSCSGCWAGLSEWMQHGWPAVSFAEQHALPA